MTPQHWGQVAHDMARVLAGRDRHDATAVRDLYRWCEDFPTADQAIVAAALAAMTGHVAPWLQPIAPAPLTDDQVCGQCGTRLHVGDWPFCNAQGTHEHGANTVVPDEIPGGQWFDNGWAEPRKFYSHSEHRAALAAEGLEIRAKNAGPEDRICPRWDTVDLDAAKALLERGPQAIRAKQQRWKDATIPITVTDGETFTNRDL